MEPTQTAAGSGMLDLYTIVLHEALHTLGIVTAIGDNGLGRLSGKYTEYDTFIANDGSNYFLDVSDIYNITVSPIFQSTVTPLPALVPGCGNDPLLFNGIFNTGQVLYTPGSWDAGSSLSHFNCPVPESTCLMGMNGYMMNAITCIGRGTATSAPKGGLHSV